MVMEWDRAGPREQPAIRHPQSMKMLNLITKEFIWNIRGSVRTGLSAVIDYSEWSLIFQQKKVGG